MAGVSTDVHNLILKHQRRLEQHRQFLREQASPSSPLESAAATIPQERSQRPAVSGAPMEWSVDDDGTRPLLPHESVAAGRVRRQPQPQVRVHRDPAAAVISYGSTDDGFGADSSPSASARYGAITAGGVPAMSSRASGASFSPDRESHAFTNPSLGDRYVVQSPTRLYERGQMFLSAHNRQMAAMRGERSVREVSECTFRPSRTKALESVSAQRLRLQHGGGSNDEEAGIRDALPRKTFLRSSKRAKEAAHKQREWNPSTLRERTRSPGRTSVARQLALSPSVCSHVARQVAARHEKVELTRRNFCDGSGWTGAPTIPKSFEFASRVPGITALRRPVIVDYGVVGRGGAAADEDALAVRARARSPRTGSGVALRASPREQPAPARDADAERDEFSPSEADRRGGGSDGEFELEAKMQLQATEIDNLHGLVATLTRELNVAKAKVREVALQQQVTDQQWVQRGAVVGQQQLPAVEL